MRTPLDENCTGTRLREKFPLQIPLCNTSYFTPDLKKMSAGGEILLYADFSAVNPT